MKNNLSKTEQEIYFNLGQGEIYDILTISGLVHLKKRTLLVLLARMNKKGWITRLKKGIYLVNAPNLKTLKDPFLAALNTFNGYLGFSSALYVYGAMDEYPSAIFVCTQRTSASKTLNKTIEVRAVALGKRATGAVSFKDYFVSSKSKTLYDSFYLPQHSGGYSNILAAIPRLDLSDDDWKTFLFYAQKFGKSGFCRKVGFLLELLNHVSDGAVPSDVLKGLNLGKQLVKLGNGRHGKFIKKWHIMDYIEEKDLMGKIYHG